MGPTTGSAPGPAARHRHRGGGGADGDRGLSLPQGGAVRRARQYRRDPADHLPHHAARVAGAAAGCDRAGRAGLVADRPGDRAAPRRRAVRRQPARRDRRLAVNAVGRIRTDDRRGAVAGLVADAVATLGRRAATGGRALGVVDAAARPDRQRRRTSCRRPAGRWPRRDTARPDRGLYARPARHQCRRRGTGPAVGGRARAATPICAWPMPGRARRDCAC